MNNLHDLFYYDETSPSGLRWKVDVYTLKHRKRKLKSKGDVAGSRHYRKNKEPKCWEVSVKSKSIGVHRVIIILNNIELLNKQIVDHLDGNPFNNKIENLKVKSTEQNNRNLKRNTKNKSGVTGVCVVSNSYFRAYWYEDGVCKSKNFSIKIHGHEKAFELATCYRSEMILKLNEKGYLYEQRHGT